MATIQYNVVYRLRSDTHTIDGIQHATKTTLGFGIMRTHGLFGSAQWWQHIENGRLRLHTLKGVVLRLYVNNPRVSDSMIVRSENGIRSEWLPRANGPELGALYHEGHPIEVDYVVQRARLFSPGYWPQRRQIAVEIRLGTKPLFRVAYRLARETKYVVAAHRNKTKTLSFGSMPIETLSNAKQWFRSIRCAPVHTINGLIIGLEKSNNDSTVIVRSDDNTVIHWKMELSKNEFGDLYTPGRRVELDVVDQRTRFGQGGFFPERVRIVVEIRLFEESDAMRI